LPLAPIAALKKPIRTKPVATGYNNKLQRQSHGSCYNWGAWVPSDGETAPHSLLNGETPTRRWLKFWASLCFAVVTKPWSAAVAMYAVVIYAPLYLKATIGAGAT